MNKESDKKIIKEYVNDDGIKITEYDDGTTIFKPVSMPVKIKEDNDKSFWQKIKNWWKTSDVKPYAKIRDLSDPYDKLKNETFEHDGSGSKNAIEIGVKVSF